MQRYRIGFLTHIFLLLTESALTKALNGIFLPRGFFLSDGGSPYLILNKIRFYGIKYFVIRFG